MFLLMHLIHFLFFALRNYCVHLYLMVFLETKIPEESLRILFFQVETSYMMQESDSFRLVQKATRIFLLNVMWWCYFFRKKKPENHNHHNGKLCKIAESN